MKVVYTAESVAEGRMIADLLEREGVKANIEGEYLAGGAGGLPAQGMVRVVVDERDYDGAERIIGAWREAPDNNVEALPRTKRSGLVIFLLGLITGGALTWWALRSPYAENPVDLDGNGIADETWLYVGDYPRRVEYDRNQDGRVDAYYVYDRRGLIKEYHHDSGFDGSFDLSSRFQNGWPVRTEFDVDGDGRFDSTEYSKFGEMEHFDVLDPRTGEPRTRTYSCGTKIVAADIDEDGDGTFDRSIVYDYYGLEHEHRDVLFSEYREECDELILIGR